MNNVSALKVPPHSIEMEQAVLGAILTVPYIVDDVIELLATENFYRPEHQTIFKACVDLIADNKAVDTLTVADRMKRTGNLREEELVYLADLASSTRGASNVKYYCKQIVDKSLERDLISVSNKVADSAYNGSDSTEDKLQAAQAQIMAIGEDRDKTDLVHVNRIAREVVEEIDRRCELGDGLIGLSTGFIDIDDKTGGFENGNLIVIAGRPSMGKTLFAMNIAEKAAIDGKFVQVFSLEMPRNDLLMRSYASVGSVFFNKIRKGTLGEEDWPGFNHAVAKLKDTDLWIDDTPMITTSQIRTRARRLQRKRNKKIDLIVVDYIQIMGDSPNKDTNTRISQISMNLKSIAKEFDCPVVAISQLNRKVDERKDKRPFMSDLRDSGAIEQDADIIMLVYRDEYYNPNSSFKGMAEVNIGKQRNGETGIVNLVAQLSYMRFRNFVGELPDQPPPDTGQFNFLDSDNS